MSVWGRSFQGPADGGGGGDCQLAQALSSAAGVFIVVVGVGATSDGALSAGVVAWAASWGLCEACWSVASQVLDCQLSVYFHVA